MGADTFTAFPFCIYLTCPKSQARSQPISCGICGGYTVVATGLDSLQILWLRPASFTQIFLFRPSITDAVQYENWQHR
jgi:hypothetical protein